MKFYFEILLRSGSLVITTNAVHDVITPLSATTSPAHSENGHHKFAEVQEKRKMQVHSVCQKYNLINKEFEDIALSLVADIDEKFVFCNNYKVRVRGNWEAKYFTLVNVRLIKDVLIFYLMRYSLVVSQ